MNSKKSPVSAKEIDRRVRQIQGHWDDTERAMRKVAGETRCETLMSILIGFEEVA